MTHRQDWVSLIRSLSPKYGLDPDAVLAVASAEGLSGGVGDQGTSFGPFQLHVGGALPSGRGQSWAESRAGIEYALQQMASSGARGLKGRAAIDAIVRNFERPAAPGAEINRAYGVLGSIGGGTPAPGRAPVGLRESPGAPGSVSAAPGLAIPQNVLDSVNQGLRLQAAPTLDAGGVPQHVVDQVNLQLPKFVGQAPKVILDKRGSLAAPRTNSAPATPGAAGIVGLAAKQIGQPYVWGGESRSEGGFDCSGLVDWALRQQGYTGPRLTTWSIAKLGQSVKGQKLMPGDLILANGGKHVVIYAGGGKVIAAPHTGTVVQYQPIGQFNIMDVRRL